MRNNFDMMKLIFNALFKLANSGISKNPTIHLFPDATHDKPRLIPYSAIRNNSRGYDVCSNVKRNLVHVTKFVAMVLVVVCNNEPTGVAL